MLHKRRNKTLGRPTAHRYAMLRNLAVSLISYDRVETTLLRAKSLRSFIEPLITLGKKKIDGLTAGSEILTAFILICFVAATFLF